MKSFPKPQNTILTLKIKTMIFFYIVFFLIMLFARIGTLLCASNYFAGLTGKQILLSFLHGARFDLHIMGLILIPLFILFMIPFRSKKIIKIFVYIFIFLCFALSLFIVSDIIFFAIFNNHIGIEILTSFTHIGLFVQMAFQTYYYITIPLLIGAILVFYFSNRYLDRIYNPNKEPHFVRNSIFVILLLIPLMFFMLKGKMQIHGRNVGLMDAQVLGTPKTVDLILNAPYTTINAIHKRQNRKLYFDNPVKGISIATEQEELLNQDNPFERKRISFNKQNKDYNFVLVILESFDPLLIDKYPDVIPNFMKLKNEGLYYKNFYSSGMRSLIGVTATLFSVPYVWGLPTMKTGLGGNEFSRIATYFVNKNYSTLNIITDLPSADNANLMAQYLGFDSFYSKNDIPVKNDYPIFHKGFDYEGLEFLIEKINKLNNKFFAYFYTSSLHNPYNILLSEKYKLYPMDTEEHQFLNRTYYTDVALGNFLTKARKEPWFKNTIFLFLPDHRAPLSNRMTDDITESKFKSFLLIYGPEIEPQTSNIFVTQEDVLPTLIDLLNTSQSYSSSGQSLFDKERNKDKFIYEENKNTVHIIGPKIRDVFSEETLEDFSSLSDERKQALQFNEAVFTLLKNNTWKKK